MTSVAQHREEKSVRLGERGLMNRLKSIEADASWVTTVVEPHVVNAETFANLRCGSWYTHPGKSSIAYFKSTDGHPGSWAFARTRLNLSVARSCATRGSCIIVDSTKYGKRFSDALARTVPLWCAVLNRVVLGHSARQPSVSELLPSWIPPSEVDCIQKVVNNTLEVLDASIANVIRSTLCPVMHRPLQTVFWCQPSSSARAVSESESSDSEWASLPPDTHEEAATVEEGEGERLPVYTVVCVNASRFVDDLGDLSSSHAGWAYVPGAGDDAENWAGKVKREGVKGEVGLTPRLFWEHKAELLASKSDDECRDAILRLQVLHNFVDARVTAALKGTQPDLIDDTDATVSILLQRLETPVPISSSQVSIARLLLESRSLEQSTVVSTSATVLCNGSSSATGIPQSPGRVLILVTQRTAASAQNAAVTFYSPACNTFLLRLCLPHDKPGMRLFADAWVHTVFPAVQATVQCLSKQEHVQCIVARDESEVCMAPVCALIAAAAHLALRGDAGTSASAWMQDMGSGSSPVNKDVIRAAVACALLAVGAPSIERWLVKELNRWLMPGWEL